MALRNTFPPGDEINDAAGIARTHNHPFVIDADNASHHRGATSLFSGHVERSNHSFGGANISWEPQLSLYAPVIVPLSLMAATPQASRRIEGFERSPGPAHKAVRAIVRIYVKSCDGPIRIEPNSRG